MLAPAGSQSYALGLPDGAPVLELGEVMQPLASVVRPAYRPPVNVLVEAL
jgi:hypothetical protein